MPFPNASCRVPRIFQSFGDDRPVARESGWKSGLDHPVAGPVFATREEVCDLQARR